MCKQLREGTRRKPVSFHVHRGHDQHVAARCGDTDCVGVDSHDLARLGVTIQ
jgi:hypothetical protein